MVYHPETVELSKILEKPHKIPKFQREYDWTVKECGELFEDLAKFTKKRNKNS
jgi:uncharacterized protein with ParB-like and HNH nuclease domain